MSCDQTVIVLDSDEGRDWMATQEIEFWPEPIVFTKQPQELSSPAPGSVCFTHYAEHCKPPWLAIHRESAMRILSGYRLTDAQKSDVGHLMAGFCNVLERAGLLYYGDTEGEAVAKACGLIPPNEDEEIPAHELANLCSVWRGHAAKCDGDMKLALESCAMDLDRLRDLYSPNKDSATPVA
jgi:hypothetical protein